MSLATLAHQRWATVTVTTSTAPGILNHIYDAITQANDYASVAIASPLTSVTKRGGTTESVDFGFGAASLNVKGQISGVNAARTPLMSGSTNGAHTWTANFLMAGLTKNAGAYSAWDHASAPFTSGQTVGLSKFFDCGTVTASKIHALVTAETLWVFIESATGTVFGFGMGAHLDPESTGANSAESDGRLYSVAVTGTISALQSGMHASTLTNFLNHQNSNNQAHFLTLTPGGSTCKRTSRLMSSQASTTTTLTTPDGEPVALPLYFYDTVNDRFLGRLREVRAVRDAKINQRQDPGTDAWYYVSGSPSADQDALGFLA
jgi:hypothetical protein